MMKLEIAAEWNMGSRLGQLRAVPVKYGSKGEKGILLAYSADFEIDPYVEMFFYPTDPLKLALVGETGRMIWTKELGKGVVPGIWFCPVFAFDLDGDGLDEIWYVGNADDQHPFSLNHYELIRLDAATGGETGRWPWHHVGYKERLGHQFRNFLAGGYVCGKPVLVTAQGTYENMYIQGWNAGMSQRFAITIDQQDPGARGSHMCPVVDINHDGSDELLWGERCISLDTGEELFCADRDSYNGHSDVIQPVLDRHSGAWSFFACRESGNRREFPRVAMYSNNGERLWGGLDNGHMDMGWAARAGSGGEAVCMSIRIGAKTCGPDGRFHQDIDEFVFDAATGKEIKLPFNVYRTIPVDLNGDGIHEFVRGMPGGDGAVFDRSGRELLKLGGTVAMAARFTSLPGEQLLVFYEDGTVKIWADRNAEDTEAARMRYGHPYYRTNSRLFGVGYHISVLGGL